MKLATLVFTLALAPAAALACPNLAGNWHCTTPSEHSSEDLVTTQAAIPNGMLYTTTNPNGTQDQLAVDGAPHSTTNPRGWVTTFNLTCQSDALITGTVTLTTSDQSFSADGTVMMTMSDANSYTTESNAVFHQPGQPDQLSKNSTSCTRH